VLFGSPPASGAPSYGVFTLGAAGSGGISVSQTAVTVPALSGEGYADPYMLTNGLPTPFTLALQTSRTQFNEQPSGFAVPMRYATPLITGITSAAPAAGGTAFNVTGRSFGQPMPGVPSSTPLVTFMKPDGLPALQCGNVVRWSHTLITCVVPPGAGANFTVAVTAGNQTGYSSLAGLTFSYLRPALASIAVEQWPAAVYTNWPAAWNTNRSVLSNNGSTVVTAPFSLRNGHGPTNGRYLVTLYGSNFGLRTPGQSCVFATQLFSYVDCTAPANAQQLQCRCTSDAAAAADAACRQSFMPLQAAAIAGLARAPFAAVCDGLESYIGEGELHDSALLGATGALGLDALRSNDAYASGFIVSWSDTAITFSMPPGGGAVVLTVGARAQFPFMHQEAVFTYDAPVLSGLYALTGSLGTSGGDIVLITGSNLALGFPSDPEAFTVTPPASLALPAGAATGGAVVVNEPSVDAMFALVASRRSLPIGEGAIVPAVGTTLRWWLYCLSNAHVYDNPRPLGGYAPAPYLSLTGCQNRNASLFTVVRQRHDSLLVRVHPGIGQGRNASLELHSDVALMARTPAPLPFSYAAPQLRAYRPSNVFLVGNQPFPFTAAGLNFGDISDDSAWSPGDKLVELSLDAGIPVNFTSRQVPGAQDAALGYGVVQGTVDSPSDMTMGPKTVTVRVAGQVGVQPANSTVPVPAIFGCKPGASRERGRGGREPERLVASAAAASFGCCEFACLPFSPTQRLVVP
jgi:hypothetical protein